MRGDAKVDSGVRTEEPGETWLGVVGIHILGEFRLKLNLDRFCLECLVEVTFFCVIRVFSAGVTLRVNL